MNVREKMAKAIGVVITRSERVEPKGEWLKAADAALDVMREPSVGVIAAAIEFEPSFVEQDVVDILNAMIDAIKAGK